MGDVIEGRPGGDKYETRRQGDSICIQRKSTMSTRQLTLAPPPQLSFIHGWAAEENSRCAVSHGWMPCFRGLVPFHGFGCGNRLPSAMG